MRCHDPCDSCGRLTGGRRCATLVCHLPMPRCVWKCRLVSNAAMAFAFLFVVVSEARGAALVERGPWSGAVTPYSAMVKAKLAREGAVARLFVSRNPQFTNPLYAGPDRAEAGKGRVVALAIRNLVPGTQY